VLGVGDEPDGNHPLVEPERGILEDRADLNRELLTWMPLSALPQTASRDKAHVVPVARGAAHDAIRPARFDYLHEAPVGVSVVANRFGQRLRAGHGLSLHDLSLLPNGY